MANKGIEMDSFIMLLFGMRIRLTLTTNDIKLNILKYYNYFKR